MAETPIKSNQEPNAQPLAEGAKAVPPKKQGSNNKVLIIVLIVVLVLFVLPGIALFVFLGWLSRGDNAARVTENLIESATGNQVDVNNENGFSISNEDGSFTVGGEKLPADFPSEVAVFEPQKILAALSNTDSTGKSWYVTAETDSTLEEVDSFIANEFSDWTTISSSTFNNTKSYSFEKGSLSVQLTVGANEESKTSITYTVQQTSE